MEAREERVGLGLAGAVVVPEEQAVPVEKAAREEPVAPAEKAVPEERAAPAAEPELAPAVAADTPSTMPTIH